METEFNDLPLLKYLEEHGVTLKDILDTALELYIPHPGVETREKAIELFKAGFYEALTDVNVAVLEVACFEAEEAGQAGRIPLLPKEQFKRPGLIVDEYPRYGNSRLHRRNQRNLRIYTLRPVKAWNPKKIRSNSK